MSEALEALNRLIENQSLDTDYYWCGESKEDADVCTKALTAYELLVKASTGIDLSKLTPEEQATLKKIVKEEYHGN